MSLKSIMIAALILTAGSGVVAEDQQDQAAANQFLMAYESMTMADWLTGQDMAEEAIELYDEALDVLQQLKKDYPHWQPRVLAFRINYCKTRLAKLKSALPAPEQTPTTRYARDIEPSHPETTTKKADSKDTKKKALEEPRYTAIIQAAEQMERAGKLKSAIDIYTSILAEQPGHRTALKGAVRCYLRIGSIDQAFSALQKGITAPVSDADLHLLMALVECYNQQFDKAIQLLRLSLEENPANADTHVVLGVALMRTGNVNAAREEMKKALSLNSKLHEAYYNLTWITLKQDPANIPVACVHYQNALKYGADPDPVLDKLLK